MSFRTTISLGFVAMLLLVGAIGGYALYTVQQLDQASRTTQRANLYSIELGQQMLRTLDELATAPASAVARQRFRQVLTREAGNITERGERELIDSLIQTLADYEQRLPATQATAAPVAVPLQTLRAQTHRLIALNIVAFEGKQTRATRLAARSNQLLQAGVALAVLVALLLVWSVPAIAVAPLQLLQTAIRHASERDFNQSIPIESRDEFGAVARDFNLLLVQLNEFRSTTTAELLTERNRLASVINTLDEGLLLLDQNRSILLANPRATQLLGLSVDKLVGRSASELAAANELFRTMLRSLDAASRPSSSPEPLPVLTIDQEGEERYYRLAVHDIVSFNAARDQFEFVGYILALHNVSDFKKLDQVKSNFLATVSHELKTPLASLSLSLKILQDERVATDERQRVLTGMRQETQRLQRLVSELLDVARLESGNIVLAPRPVAVAELVRYATEPVAHQLAQHQLTIVTELPPDLPLVLADVEKTSWVLLNLLVNAIRYSPVGERITIAAQAEGSAVRISVHDHGPGIAPENHERIFQRFTQLPNQTGYQSSSGLGLSIAREFITAQGGRIGVESALGAGSTFYFTLPVVTS